jgi:uncharacterized protein (DUF433 family)
MAKFHWDDYIEERKDVMLGKPVFKGTRPQDELLAEFPHLKTENIRAAMLFAVAALRPVPGG